LPTPSKAASYHRHQELFVKKVYQVLFICSGNSDRSIMGEAILRQMGGDRFSAHSAGSHPTGRVNALAFDELARRDYPTQGLASKSWALFARADAPELDVVIVVCANAASERAPNWRGTPRTLNWDLLAPGQVNGSDEVIRAAFSSLGQQVEESVGKFVRETLRRESDWAPPEPYSRDASSASPRT
jgi:arsenate reductase